MKTGIIILRPIGSEMNKVVIDQTFGTAELLLFGSAQMTEPFSAEHRTFFFTTYCIFKMATLDILRLTENIFCKKCAMHVHFQQLVFYILKLHNSYLLTYM